MSQQDGEPEVLKLKARLYDVQCENAELGVTINQLGKELTDKKTLLNHAMAHIEKEAGRMYEVQRENTDLRERLELTTQQLAEARTLLARAMEHIEKQTENERARMNGASLVPATSPRTTTGSGLSVPPAQRRPSPAPAPLAGSSQIRGAAAHDYSGNRLSEPVHGAPRTTLSPASPRLGHRRSEPIHPPPTHPPPPRPSGLTTTHTTTHPRSPPPHAASPRPGGRQEQIRRMRERPVILTREELNELVVKREPQRYHEWLSKMFTYVPNAECPQEDVWTLYRETFAAYAPHYPHLAAADVINLIPDVFPQTRNLVIEDPQKRYIVRGLDRRKETH